MAYLKTSPKLHIAGGALAEVESDLLVVACRQDAPLSAAVKSLDASLGGLIQGLLDSESFKGRALEFEWIFPAPTATRRILLVGAGKPGDLDAQVLRHIAGAAVRQARNKKAGRVCLAIDTPPGMDSNVALQNIADGALTALSESDLYKDQAKKGTITDIAVWSEAADGQASLDRGKAIAEAVNFGRWLGDEPANVMSPERVAAEVSEKAKALEIECEILDEAAIRDAGMLSMLSVSQGSARAPRVIVLRYNGGGDSPWLGYVGKGVVFDTGGISIKPAADMHYMKYDMCGAAATVSAVFALAALKAKVNVMGLVGMVENMPSGTATRPGDVVRAANGKTIEIINTDAEGRLVLADVLDLARKRGAARLVDLATLTGAITVALGQVATGAMGKPQPWVSSVLQAADRAGERIWQMPLFPEYLDSIKSNIADLMNSGGRYGGALTAGIFLQQFVGDTPWVHLDIAGTAWTTKDNPWQLKGATGAMIRTLVELAEAPE